MNYIEQNKFTETIVSFRYPLELDKKKITLYNLLCFMLKVQTEEYADKQTISHVFNKNYGMKMSVGLTTYGQHVCLQRRFQFIRTDWIDRKDYISNIIHVMEEFIYHPVFTKENLEEAKFMLKNRLMMQMDDPTSLSILTALQMIGDEYSISIPTTGYLEDVDDITLEQVESLYASIQQMNPLIYVCGFLEDEMKEQLSKFKSTDSIDVSYSILPPTIPYKEKRISKQIEQSYISRVYATQTDTVDADYYTLLLMNAILGQSPTNLLFTEIREKNSFCYSIGSSIIRFDGALYIYVGCQKENIEQVLELMDVQIQRLIDMDYEDEKLDIAKKDWIDGMTAGLDNQYSYIERKYISNILQTSSTLKERIEKIQSVTKEDISNCAKKLVALSCCIVEEA